MHTLLTQIAIGVVYAILMGYALWRATVQSDLARAAADDCEESTMAVSAERARITNIERDVDALRRELRKLSGKFYAAQREDEYPTEPDGRSRDVCENWGRAQLEGPMSKAARCDCAYCTDRRAQRKSPLPGSLS